MSGMLLGIFVLILYGLGTMGVIRRTPFIVLHCNDSSLTNEVYYHYLVQEEVQVPFNQLSEHLSDMGVQYPELHINIMFLIDNTNRFRRSIHYYAKRDQIIRELQTFGEFHLKYNNVNVTTMLLTKYLAMTPWRYKWKKIPTSNLLFYLRVYSIWKNGGIGMNLDTFSSRHLEHPAVTAIMKQQDYGIKTQEYTHRINKLDRDEQNEFASLFYGILHQILNETRSFINKSMTFSENYTKKDMLVPFVRTHRNKRDVPDSKNDINLTSKEVTTSTPTNELVNTSDLTIINAPYRDTDHDLAVNNNKLVFAFDSIQPTNNKTSNFSSKEDSLNTTEIKVRIPIRNVSEIPQVLLFYDFSFFSEAQESPYMVPETMVPSNLSPMNADNCNEQDMLTTSEPIKNQPYMLAIALDGSFIAASSKQHPFLGHIISTACQRMSPRFSIQDAIVTQCSAIFNDDVYCGNIYII